MFARRAAQPLFDRLRQWLWPRTGWGRAVSYYWHRLQRIPGTPASIAAGFACGVAVSFTPLVGLHLLLGFGIAWALRASLLAAAIGTLVVNPWTAPVVWFSTYYTGTLLLPGEASFGSGLTKFVAMFVAMTEAALKLDLVLFERAVWPVFLPMLVGSLPVGLVAGFVTYFALEPVMRALQARRVAKRAAARVMAQAAAEREGSG
ncbi:MAG: DUF2062 domain-containing protein [Rhodospirillaceae bacterium]|nr:DUF2062 domain-containing protein [Rhodospirillaceae bacterium]